jgi:hypothetical protein
VSLFQDLSHDGELAKHLRANGRPATATITSVTDTGLTLGGLPVLDLDLDVRVNGDAVYAVSHRQAVEPHEGGRAVVGETFEARVDPERPSVLLLVL